MASGASFNRQSSSRPSHSSGGGSSHGPSHGPSRGPGGPGGGFHMHRRPINFMWGGRTVVISTGKQNAVLSFLAVFILALIVTFGGVWFRSEMKDELADSTALIASYEEDAKWYSEVISKAKNGESGYYLATATYDKTFVNYYNSYNPRDGVYADISYKNIEYYFIRYKFFNEATGKNEYGETPTMFMGDNADSWNGKIAYAWSNKYNDYVSIVENYSLDSDIRYKDEVLSLNKLKDNKKSATTFVIVATVISVALFAGLVVTIVFVVKKAKREAEINEAKQQAELKKAQEQAEEAEARANQVGRVCAYCGSAVPDGRDNCPACGARVFKKK